ncbi:LPXTG cell wall anchor domain-containing protein [Corynebacterium sp. ES2730-CONJ]|uniref:LPXTG cell wall anchor domain-containing protein n=1 Tax=Corynebacterium sp. ES2730-CONJ TaxID=2973941 RepID=UPI00216ABC30|nr:LPXTG cell wall anchor domain-containing protein [Corynebacterium sp. ES2730-CONJ]MCS4531598.1 LPXTG cell wall anchor domain-containing protein [Corynebacterium sp. ES2730-CONJ]
MDEYLIKPARIVRIGVPLATACALSVAATIGFGEPGWVSSPQAHAAVTGFANPAPAADTIDLDRDITVEIRIPSNSGLSGEGSAGYTVTLTKLDTDPINTTQGYTKAARLSVTQAKRLGQGDSYSEVTNAQGTVVFSGLKPGVYLFKATPPAGDGRKTQEDVIVIPIIDKQGEWSYNLALAAKFEVPPTPTPTPPPSPPVTITPPPPVTNTPPPPSTTTPPAPPVKGMKSLPMTGAGVIGLVGLAGLLILAGFWVLAVNRRRNSQQ